MNLKINDVKIFLYIYFKGREVDATEAWTSFKVKICETSHKVTPMSLVKAEDAQTTGSENVSGNATEKDDLWMALYLCTIYRVSYIQYEDHRNVILGRLEDQLKTMIEDFGNFDIHRSEIYSKYKHFVNDSEYVKLIACCDMFYYKFKTAPEAILRLGTLSSRFKDCASLLTFRHLGEVMGYTDPDEILDWIFVKSLAEKVDRMMKGTEELDNQYSYLPYLSDLQLTTQSHLIQPQ